MLSKKEDIIMNYIYEKCRGKQSVLIYPDDLVDCLKPKFTIKQKELSNILNGLVLDNYITLILSDKAGKPIYCISLDKKGESYYRDKINAKKTLIKLIVRTILLAILSTTVGLIIKAMFK